MTSLSQKSPAAQTAAPTLAFRLKNFALGGVAGMCATCCIQPIDMVKVRIQVLSGENPGTKYTPLTVGKQILRNDGYRAFYKGLDAALMRQLTYTTSRFGIFLNLQDYMKRSNDGKQLSLGQNMICSLTAGGLGSIVGNPADMILVRLQADTLLPPDQRRGYRNFFDAAKRIPAEEGILGLWTGCAPTIIRAMSLNLGMFTTYEEAKKKMRIVLPNNPFTGFVIASFFAGGVASAMSLPFDNAKTKLQKQVPDANGNLPYKHIFDAMSKTVVQDGPKGLWVGLPTFILRISPHVMITFICAEKLKKLFL